MSLKRKSNSNSNSKTKDKDDLDYQLALKLQSEFDNGNISDISVIRNHQDDAFNKSLLADQEKERQKKELEMCMEIDEEYTVNELRIKRLEHFQMDIDEK
jgi:hypothetical protein